MRATTCTSGTDGHCFAGNAPSIGLIEKLGLTFDEMITMPGDDEAICLYSKALGQQ